MGRPHKCPYCGQSTSISKGVRRTKTLGDRCIRLCKSCRRKYTPRYQQGPEAREGSAEAVTEVVREDGGPWDETTVPDDTQLLGFRPALDLVREPGGAE